MNDSKLGIVVIRHPKYPGVFHFRDWASVDDFLAWHMEHDASNNEIIVWYIFNKAVELCRDECDISIYFPNDGV